jgi:DNA-binding MarR family transcriptional regulator
MSTSEDEEANGHAITWPLERLARVMRAREHGHGLTPAQREALRFLSRTNRYSDSPSALTRYLGATKGTISQTLIALERKGLIAKSARESGPRSVRLSLTAKGREALANDPWTELSAAAEALGGKTRRRLQRGLEELLEGELKRASLASFGACSACRYFRERGREGDAKGPHLCMLYEEPLTAEDSRLICIAQEPAG